MSKNGNGFKSVMNFMAFVAIILIAISLILSKLDFASSINSACTLIANVIAYIMVAISSLYFVRSRRGIGYVITWIICVVLIVVMMFLK